jgi:RNA polymerase sigma-70 factor (ECF subfamily)
MMRSKGKLEDLSPNLGSQERDFVFAVAMKFVKNEIDAEDVAQDALVLAHRHKDSFRGQSKYSTWLYRVAVTTALMHLRSKKRRGREVSCTELSDKELDWISALESKAPSPESLCASREELSLVDRELRKLGSKYTKLLRLRWFEGYSEKECGKRLGLPITTVKTRAFRARHAVTKHALYERRQAA